MGAHLNLIEGCIILDQLQHHFQTEERCGVPARLQDDAPLGHEHAAFTVRSITHHFRPFYSNFLILVLCTKQFLV